MSGVGAYEKNGAAERAIQIVVGSARTMMLYHALLWTAHLDMRLCPFVLEHAAYLWNHLPYEEFLVAAEISPIELYNSSKLDMSRLRNEKT